MRAAAAIEPGVPVDLTIDLRDPQGAPVAGLEVVHEKTLHLLVVSSDLAWFDHVHPVRRADGVFDVRVALHPEVSVTVKVNVARSPEEAEMQSQGVDVMAAMFEKDETGFVEAYDPNAEPGATAEVQPEAEPAAEGGDEA